MKRAYSVSISDELIDYPVSVHYISREHKISDAVSK